jgi:hypothetical protein
LGKH